MRLADPNEQLVPDSIKLYLIWRQMDLNSATYPGSLAMPGQDRAID